MEKSDPQPIVGIDLGTTMSAVGLFSEGQVRLLKNDLGETLTPSVVARDSRSGQLVVGRVARDILALRPDLAAATFKRDMGGDRAYPIGEESLTPVELSAYVLGALRNDAERRLGLRVGRCVVTVPAYFSEAQRFATKQAGELAGLMVERILNEPTAAAISHGLHRGEEESRFMVFDLGGGTFDVCVMELFEGMLEVRSVAGESRLGGEDFSERLALRVLEEALGAAPPAWEAVLKQDHAGAMLLFKRVELLKRKLSRWPSAEVTVPALSGLLDRPRPLSLTADQAEQAYRPLLDRLVGPCWSALRGAELKPADLEHVLLVGGGTRLPCVRDMVADLLSTDPLQEADPELVVARGAAIQAALHAEDGSVGDIVVTDVASHSLGVETVHEIANKSVPGYFSPLIHRNTVIPTSRTDTFGTLTPNQREIYLEVYEGESRRVDKNTRLGGLKIKGLPRGPAGQQVEVRFTYDLNGILEVEAAIPRTGKRFRRVFTRDGEALSHEQTRRVEERMRFLKADPLQQPRYRDLLGRAELLWKDLPSQERELLGELMDQFEGALSSRTPATMDQAYEQLRQFCEQLDGGERW